MAEDILAKLQEPTDQLRTEVLQKIMIKGRQQSKLTNIDTHISDQIIELLWTHLRTGFKKFDDQLLCGTCFYTVIRLTSNQDYYINEVLQIIEQELLIKNTSIIETRTALAVSLMYGLFQSSFLIHGEETDVEKINNLLGVTCKLLILMGYEYTQYTFVVFKTIRTFKNVCGTNLEQSIFNKDNQIRLLNLINHNWENPITGIRDQIRSIFQTVISTLDEKTYHTVLEDINHFYWNKAKYLMMSEIIDYENKVPKVISDKKLVEGLVYSLYKPGLVSAGADLYYAVLKTIKSEQIWCDMFLDSVVQICEASSIKPMENFNNYWCLTTLKKFPKLIDPIFDTLQNTKNDLFNCLCLMKQGNKLGLLENNINQTIIIKGLEDKNAKNRLLAFDVICIIQGTFPTMQHYTLILNFLTNNLNTDCTVLRLSILGSVTYLLNQLHVLFINNIEENYKISELLKFCKNLQELIIKSLYVNGNYQRKVTSVKLCNLIWSALSEVPRKKRDQTRKPAKSLIECLEETKYWLLSEKEFINKLLSLLKDPADDIRETTLKLLLNHYSINIKETEIFNILIDEALKCMKSKFFYEISCGQAIFKLIANVLLKDKVEAAKFETTDDILNFAYKELLIENKLQRNVMETIENGKQMHSFISIIHVLLETCITSSEKLHNLDKIVHDLIDILQDVTNQFSWDKGNSTSSDFSKMNDMVQDILVKYGYNPHCEDQTKISGLHQIVLNCLWLNVKASCDLAALLTQYYIYDIIICRKCLNLITHVLETSRHKGVIEAAGSALGRTIQYLTSVPDTEISELPMSLLKSKLTDMVTDANKMASITRRGAGLSIMVHRIVSSDLRRDKPLFHYFLTTLLKICNKVSNVPILNDQNLENQIDLPKALYIHFLTRIVTDSSLSSDMMYYSTELSELAFGELTSPHWQIRNAALQLYGALVPKLVGQKKPSGSDDETVATVACDELKMHSPKLWMKIIEMLQNKGGTKLLKTHSNFVPILNMLANIAVRYNFSFDNDALDWEKTLLECFLLLLGSPIYTVRRLTAKCIYNIFSFDVIYASILHLGNISENLLHGVLTLIKILQNHYSNTYLVQIQHLQKMYRSFLLCGDHNYLTRELFEDISCYFEFDQAELINTLTEVYNNKHAPGVFLWAHNRAKTFIQKSSWDQIPKILQIILTHSDQDFEIYCEYIKEKLGDCNIEDSILKNIVNIMINFENNISSSVIWEILYKISLKIDLSYIDVEKLLKDLKKEKMFKLRYMIPLIARVLLNANMEVQKEYTILVSSLSNPEQDVDMREMAVLANNAIADIFFILSDQVRVLTLKTAIVLLQDEDEDIRNLSVDFYKKLTKVPNTMHAFLCLNKLLDPKYLVTLFDDPKESIPQLCKHLDAVITDNSFCTVDEYNPFANDAKNIYLEADVLNAFILKLKCFDV